MTWTETGRPHRGAGEENGQIRLEEAAGGPRFVSLGGRGPRRGHLESDRPGDVEGATRGQPGARGRRVGGDPGGEAHRPRGAERESCARYRLRRRGHTTVSAEASSRRR